LRRLPAAQDDSEPSQPPQPRPQSKPLQAPPQQQAPLQPQQRPARQSQEIAAPQQPPPNLPPSSVPYVDDRRLDASMSALDPILQRYQPVPTRSLPIAWQKKSRGRVGDASMVKLRATIAAGALGAFAIGTLAFFLLFPVVTGRAIVLYISPTFTPSPTVTLTPSPGFTNTPSLTPRAPERPTTTPAFAAGSIYNRTSTPVYPSLPRSRFADETAGLLALGRYNQAIPTLQVELDAKSTADDEYYNTLYQVVVAYANAGQADTGLTLLREAAANQNPSEPRANENDPRFRAARAYALYANDDFDGALRDATAAFNADNRLTLAALVIARVNVQRNESGVARQILNRGLDEQPGNTVLLVERGSINLASGRIDDALSDANEALFADPLNRQAFVLRTRALIAAANQIDTSEVVERVQAFGRAVLATQEFLLYYPGAVEGWVYLGEAREGEGNISAAIDAYTQAVAGNTNTLPEQQAYLRRGLLLLGEQRFEEARSDFDSALAIRETREAYELRLEAALQLGEYTDALNDVEVLLEAAPDDLGLQVRQLEVLVAARVDQGIDQNEFVNTARFIVDDSFIDVLQGESRAIAQLYRGMLRYYENDFNSALSDLNAAVETLDSAAAHFYRGQALFELQQYDEALRDFEWVVYWSGTYRYEFTEDAESRIETIRADFLPTATPTRTFTATPTPTRTPRQ
jgi:tetratricopeptide (TPR) repeat protein